MCQEVLHSGGGGRGEGKGGVRCPARAGPGRLRRAERRKKEETRERRKKKREEEEGAPLMLGWLRH